MLSRKRMAETVAHSRHLHIVLARVELWLDLQFLNDSLSASIPIRG